MAQALKGSVDCVDEATMISKVNDVQKVAAALREATDILKELVEMSIASDPEAVYAASNLVQELARLQVVLAKEEAAVCNAEIAVDSGQERAGADCGSSSPGTVTGGAE